MSENTAVRTSGDAPTPAAADWNDVSITESSVLVENRDAVYHIRLSPVVLIIF